jgi:hypothetical protein
MQRAQSHTSTRDVSIPDKHSPVRAEEGSQQCPAFKCPCDLYTKADPHAKAVLKGPQVKSAGPAHDLSVLGTSWTSECDLTG